MMYVYAAILATFLALGGWGSYEHHEAQKAEQRLRDFERDTAVAVAKQEQIYKAQAAAQEKANDAAILNLQTTVHDAELRGADLARRLRLAAAGRPNPMPQAQDQPGAAGPAREPPGPSAADEALARYDAACQRDAARLGTLIEELQPQL